LELTVDPEDLGRVIGKRGATAQSLRTLLRALGTKNDSRYNLKIVDNGPERPERPERTERPAKSTKAVNDDNDDQDDQAVSNDDQDDATVAQDQDTNDVVSKTRKELEEFDDLDL
jgi:type II secretory pathway component GspD/PulD (secretin)